MNSARPPEEINTNLSYLRAVWDAFATAPRPLVAINQYVDLPDGKQIKVDIVAAGGREWIKVNTSVLTPSCTQLLTHRRIKESRLMAEFREQDSYLVSDSESDDEVSRESSIVLSGQNGALPPSGSFTNSLVKQAAALVEAARSLPVTPQVRYTLTRLEPVPSSDRDERIDHTLDALRAMGIHLSFLASQQTAAAPRPPPSKTLQPSRQILLDLSVLVALCCDSTHHPLPYSDTDIQKRFRPAVMSLDGKVTLADHNNVSKDLEEQLGWEVEHPLIGEILSRLQPGAEFWCTTEVQDRLPGIINLIAGPQEKRRAAALFNPAVDFWEGSRWAGSVGPMSDLNVRVVSVDDTMGCEEKSAMSCRAGEEGFDLRLLRVTQDMLCMGEEATSGPKSRTRRRGKRRPGTTSLPSAHTLRTMQEGIRRGMTILTNNRGSVSKVIREMGVLDGSIRAAEGEDARARIWVVNPACLAEWRRLEVEEKNRELLEGTISRVALRSDTT